MEEPPYIWIHKDMNNSEQVKRTIDNYNTRENQWIFDAEGLAQLKEAILSETLRRLTKKAVIAKSGMRQIDFVHIEDYLAGELNRLDKYAKKRQSKK